MGGLFFLVKINRIGGTELFAGTAFAFLDVNAAVTVDAILQGYSLGILNICRSALGNPGVVFVNDLFGTFLGAGTAADALDFVDVARVLNEFDIKIANRTLDILYFTEGFELYVQMPADLDQFG